MKLDFILASASEGRKDLLELEGFKFEVVSSSIQELSFDDPIKTVIENSKSKAKKIYELHNFDVPIVACDTIVFFDGKVIGKPGNKEDAHRILSLLSGQWHTVYSGLSVISKGKLESDFSSTKVKLKQMTKEKIQKEANTDEVLRRAGGYAIQEKNNFIEKYNGRFDVIVGIDINLLRSFLRRI